MFREYLFTWKYGHKILNKENRLQNTIDKTTLFYFKSTHNISLSALAHIDCF